MCCVGGREQIRDPQVVGRCEVWRVTKRKIVLCCWREASPVGEACHQRDLFPDLKLRCMDALSAGPCVADAVEHGGAGILR